MRRSSRFVVASTLIWGAACGGEPEPPRVESEPPPPVAAEPSTPAVPPPTPPPPTPPPPPEAYADCARGQTQRSLLAALPEYTFEYGPEYSEFERARAEVGYVSVSYSGCDYFVREYRFELSEPLDAGEPALVFARAAELMRALAEEINARSLHASAEDIEEVSASATYALGDDLTGDSFEAYYSIDVRLEEDGSVLVVRQAFHL